MCPSGLSNSHQAPPVLCSRCFREISDEGVAQESSSADETQQDIIALRNEIHRLRLELAEVRSKLETETSQNLCNDIDSHLDLGSEVYCDSFAATAWATDSKEGVRLFINQNDILTELVATNSFYPNPNTKAQWDRCFIAPVPLMPHSAIAATNSMLPWVLIPDSDATNDRGRSVMRVFYFDVDGILREWVWQDPIKWRRSTLAIKGADHKHMSAVCWAEGGRAEWSLFYMTKEVVSNGQRHGGRLLERRCSGGANAKWSRPVDIGWSCEISGVEEGVGTTANHQENDLPLQSRFSATTNSDGTDRQIFYLNRQGGQPGLQFQSLKWGGRANNKWLPSRPPSRDIPPLSSDIAAPTSFAALRVHGEEGVRINFQDNDGLGAWQSKPKDEDGKWKKFSIGSNNSSPKSLVANADQVKGNQYRRYIFSLVEGRIVQTTLNSSFGWSAQPITIRKIQHP